jgi:excisionase family DNA binding protein
VADRLLTPEALATTLLAHATAPPRLALTREEAARSLGVSLDSFERYIQADLKLIRRGRLRLVPVAELERWINENARRTLDGPCAR